MALDSADLEILLNARDNATEAFNKARESVELLDRAAGGAGGGFRQIAEQTGEASRKAEEASGIFGKLKDTLFDVGRIAAGFALGHLAFDLAESFGRTLESITSVGEATHRLQIETGATAEQASGLLAVFDRFGVSNQQAAVSIGLLERNVTQFLDRSTKAQSAATGFAGVVSQLNLSLTESSGAIRPLNDILLQVADRFQAMPDGVQKTNAAMALFGRSGRELIPVLDQGREGIQRALDTAKQYGLVLSEDNVQAVFRFSQAQKDLSEAIKGFAVQAGSLVLPALESIVRGATQLASGFSTTVLPAIRAIVDYVSTTFGPYIAAGVAIAQQAFTVFVSIVSGALNDALGVIESVGAAIADALQWLNPFAEHSPSLVAQVQDGVTQIVSNYGDVTAIGAPLADAGDAVARFANDSSTAIKGMERNTREALTSIQEQLGQAKSALSAWEGTPIAGTKAFQDQLDKISEQSDRIRLQMDQIKLGADPKAQLQALNDELTKLHAQSTTGPGGKGVQEQIKSVQQEIANVKTSGANAQLQQLQDQLDKLNLQADQVHLQEKLQLGPLQKQLHELSHPTAAEQPFAVIVAGIQKAQATIQTLTPEEAKLNAALKVEQAALADVTAAAGKATGAHGGFNTSVKGLKTPLDDMKESMARVQEQARTWGVAVQNAKQNIDNFTSGIIAFVQSIPGVSLIEASISNIFDQINGAFQGKGFDVSALLGGLANIGTGITQALSSAVSSIPWGRIWSGATGAAGDLIAAVSSWFGRIDWVGMWQKAGDFAGGLISSAGNFIGRVTTWLSDTWQSIPWGTIWSKATGIATDFAANVGHIAGAVFDWLRGEWESIAWGKIWATAKGFIGTTFKEVGDILGYVTTWLLTAWASIPWGDIWKTAVGLLSAFVTWVKGINWDAAAKAIDTALSNSVDTQRFSETARSIAERTADASNDPGIWTKAFHEARVAIAASNAFLDEVNVASIWQEVGAAAGRLTIFAIADFFQELAHFDPAVLGLVFDFINLPRRVEGTVTNIATQIGVGFVKGIGQAIIDLFDTYVLKPLLAKLEDLALAAERKELQILYGLVGKAPPTQSSAPAAATSTNPVLANPTAPVTPGATNGGGGNVTINQNFYGPTDPNQVRHASNEASLQLVQAKGVRY